jgi:hypothetical protein
VTRSSAATPSLPFEEEAADPGLLLTRWPRDAFRRVLIRDQPDRDEVASTLLQYGDHNGREWADVIDLLTMHPDERRRVVRLLGEIEATPGSS